MAALQQQTVAEAAAVAGACPRLAWLPAFAGLFAEPPNAVSVSDILIMNPQLAALRLQLAAAVKSDFAAAAEFAASLEEYRCIAAFGASWNFAAFEAEHRWLLQERCAECPRQRKLAAVVRHLAGISRASLSSPVHHSHAKYWCSTRPAILASCATSRTAGGTGAESVLTAHPGRWQISGTGWRSWRCGRRCWMPCAPPTSRVHHLTTPISFCPSQAPISLVDPIHPVLVMHP